MSSCQVDVWDGPYKMICAQMLGPKGDCYIHGQQSPPPRTWTLPPEPGPEVQVVKTASEQLWFRDYSRESDERWVRYSLYKEVGDWAYVLSLGPLTDATEEWLGILREIPEEEK